MISKNGVESLKNISEKYGNRHINKFGLKFLLKIFSKDSSTLSENEKIKKIENYIINYNNEYYIFLKYNMKPDNLIKEFYTLSGKYNVNFYVIKELYDIRDQFNFNPSESLEFIKKELELLSNEHINLLYKGHEKDPYWFYTKEYSKKSSELCYFINDTLIKKYRLFFYKKYLL